MHVPRILAVGMSSMLLVSLAGCGTSNGTTGGTPAPKETTGSPPTPASELRLPPVPSKEEGRKSYEKGMAAAKEGQYGIAARYFIEARKSDPYAPHILFNLGVAYSKAENEFLAIPWLEAYLAIQPDASNATAVRSEIQRLEKSAWAKVAKILEGALTAAGKLPNADHRKSALESVARERAAIGDVEEAIKVWKSTGDTRDRASLLWQEFGDNLRYSFDIRRSLEVLPRITDDTKLLESYRHLVNDLGYAKRTTEMMALTERCPAAFRDKIKKQATDLLAWNYWWKQEFVAVEGLLPELTPPDRDGWLGRLAEVRCKSGDVTGARSLIGRVELPGPKARALQTLALAQLARGEATAAKATVREILALPAPAAASRSPFDDDTKVVAAAVLGNLEAAVALANHAEYSLSIRADDNGRARLWGLIVEICVLAGDLTRAASLRDQFNRTPLPEEDQEYYGKFHGGRPEWGMCRGFIKKGQPQKALEFYAKTPVRLKADLLPDLVDAFIAAGDLRGAEHAISAIGPEDFDDRVDMSFMSITQPREVLVRRQATELVKLAEAHAARKQLDEARRLLGAVYQMVVGYNLTDRMNETLRRVAELQASIGDNEGSQATETVALPPNVAQWMDWASFLSKSGTYSNLEEGLRLELKDVAAEDVPRTTARFAATELGRTLFRFRAMREGQ